MIKNNELALKQVDSEEKTINQRLLQLPISEQELLNIKRKHEVTNQFYTFLLEKQAEAGIQRASTISNIRVLDKADNFNVSAVGTKKSLVYLIALMIGLILPGAVIFIFDLTDTRVKELNDIRSNTSLPVLGVVAHDKTGNSLPVHSKPGSSFAESFRHIRTNLGYMIPEPGKKLIMVTSTVSGEGKSFIALNLASIFAMNNKKVLLCGFDLRRPTLHKIFQMENREGISEILIGKKRFEDVVKDSPISGLHFLPSGPIPPNPAELLESKNMQDLLETFKAKYDYIIIDTPPMALVTDAQLISRYTDTNIFVI